LNIKRRIQLTLPKLKYKIDLENKQGSSRGMMVLGKQRQKDTGNKLKALIVAQLTGGLEQ